MPDKVLTDEKLPNGWEKRMAEDTGVKYYINIYTKRTQLNKPTITYVFEPSPNLGKKVQCSHILLKTKDSMNPTSWRSPKGVTITKEEALKKIKDLRRKIKKGEERFEDLAFNHSDCSSQSKGGDLGFFSGGQMIKEFEEEAFSLKVGQLSQPVWTIYGVHIIKRTA